MSADDNKALVRRYIEVGWSRGDLEVVIDHVVAEGDFVATRVSARGIHNGDLAGIAPTGKHVEFTASDMFKLSDGRIVESWHNVDDFGLLQQLGVIPAG